MKKLKKARTSAIPEFYKLSSRERLAFVKEFTGLSEEETALLEKWGALDAETANRMIENVVGSTQLPLGIATNFLINKRDYLIPFVTEEPSVVAAASNAAKLARASGGFTASSTEPLMIGQIQVVFKKAGDAKKAVKKVLARKKELLEQANSQDAPLVKYGGGARDLKARVLETPRGKMLLLHILVDCRDAMGANAVNTMCESLAPRVEEISGGESRLRVVSNLAVHRLARARCVWKKKVLEESTKGAFSGREVVERILDAQALAEADAFRACTHNKGIMNGIDAVCVACGQDWRAIEAGAHAFAALSGKYSPLTKYRKNKEGDLVGEIELPVAVGVVGGVTKTLSIARVCLKILGVKTAREFGEVLAAIGLAQNFAALRALSTEGISRGHMKLHAKNIAVMAGAQGREVDEVARRLIEEKKIRVDRAQEVLEEIQGKKTRKK